MVKEVSISVMQQKSSPIEKAVSNSAGICAGFFWNSALVIVYQSDRQIGVS
jgi:hypothetical protein